MPTDDEPRKLMVCPYCRPSLTHRLTVLHAGVETLTICEGNWLELPSWLQEAYKQSKGKGI